MTISMILATTPDGGLGYKNGLPWQHIPGDLVWFRRQTLDKMVVMGHRTWLSLPKRPLENRVNVVLSFRDVPEADFTVRPCLGDPAVTIERLKALAGDMEIVIIGGATVYSHLWPFVDKVYHTCVKQHFPADTFFKIEDSQIEGWTKETVHDYNHCTFRIYTRPTS